MKQFFPIGHGHSGVMNYDEAMRIMTPRDRVVLRSMNVGRHFTDSFGVVWARLPDVLGPAAATDALMRAGVIVAAPGDRLERIATAMMAAIVGKFPPGSALDDDARELDEQHARGAVVYAKALTAELDKQS